MLPEILIRDKISEIFEASVLYALGLRSFLQ